MKAKADLGNAQAHGRPSRRHRPPTARARSNTGACCPGALQQAGLRSKQRKRRLGRVPGQLLPRAPNFAPSLPPLPVSLSPATTPRSRAASQRFSHGYGPAPATSAPTKRTSIRIDSSARAAANRRPANTSSSLPALRHSTRYPFLLPPTDITLPRQPPQQPSRNEGDAPVPRRLGPL